VTYRRAVVVSPTKAAFDVDLALLMIEAAEVAGKITALRDGCAVALRERSRR
jgi:hypothetical protein